MYPYMYFILNKNSLFEYLVHTLAMGLIIYFEIDPSKREVTDLIPSLLNLLVRHLGM